MGRNNWTEIPKALYSPEELIFTDYTIELHLLYDGRRIGSHSQFCGLYLS